MSAAASSNTGLRVLHGVGFRAFLATQFLGAFNDNLFKMLLVCFALKVLTKEEQNNYIPLATALFTLPYILFSSYAGFLADRFSKRQVMIATKAAEIVIMSFGYLFFLRQTLNPLLLVLFTMGAQSAFFGPAKYGFLPEVLPANTLSRGNGAVQLFTFLAIILGAAAAGRLSTVHTGAIHLAALYCIGVAIIGFITSLLILPTPPGHRNAVFSWNPLSSHWQTLRAMRRDHLLILCLLGNSYFWFMGALFQSNLPMLVKNDLLASDQTNGLLLAAVALGIGIGSSAAGLLSRGKIEYGMVLPGGALMALFSIVLGILGHWLIPAIVCVSLMGFSSGFFQLPLVTAIQQRSPEDRRGQFMGAVNAVDCLAMLLAAACHWLLIKPLGLSPSAAFVVLGALTIAVLLVMSHQAPALLWRAKKLTTGS